MSVYVVTIPQQVGHPEAPSLWSREKLATTEQAARDAVILRFEHEFGYAPDPATVRSVCKR